MAYSPSIWTCEAAEAIVRVFKSFYLQHTMSNTKYLPERLNPFKWLTHTLSIICPGLRIVVKDLPLRETRAETIKCYSLGTTQTSQFNQKVGWGASRVRQKNLSRLLANTIYIDDSRSHKYSAHAIVSFSLIFLGHHLVRIIYRR